MAIDAYDLIEINVHAVAQGQAINNKLYYRAQGTPPGVSLAAVLQDFADEWRASVLTFLSDAYQVELYEAKIIDSLIFLNDTGNPETSSRPVIRYSESATVQGVATGGPPATDQGQEAGAAHATFATINVEKVGGEVVSFTSPPVVLAAEKVMKGRIAFSPILETRTEILDGNALTAATITDVADAMTALDDISDGYPAIQMCIVSRYKNNVHRRSGPAGDGLFPGLAVALCSSYVVNPNLSSQVSRKERGRGGA